MRPIDVPQKHIEAALEVLIDIAQDEDIVAGERASAACAILDYAEGPQRAPAPAPDDSEEG